MNIKRPFDEHEIKLLETLRKHPEIKELVDRLCSISRDDEEDCYSGGDAESEIEKTGQQLKLRVLESWAQSCSSKRESKQAKLENAKRSKKN